jgi:hypothetical protein
MRVDHHGQETFGRDDAFSAQDRVPEHRTIVDEGTVLLRAVATEACSDERLKPLPLAARQDNAPEMLSFYT